MIFALIFLLSGTVTEGPNPELAEEYALSETNGADDNDYNNEGNEDQALNDVPPYGANAPDDIESNSDDYDGDDDEDISGDSDEDEPNNSGNERDNSNANSKNKNSLNAMENADATEGAEGNENLDTSFSFADAASYGGLLILLLLLMFFVFMLRRLLK